LTAAASAKAVSHRQALDIRFCIDFGRIHIWSSRGDSVAGGLGILDGFENHYSLGIYLDGYNTMI
jgi:hypothetical protein